MKRGNSSGSNQEQSSGVSSVGGGSCSMVAKNQDAGGMDELLAMSGYTVRSSDMAEVAHKLEQLEMFMGLAQEDGISHLASDTVHYNPSDVSGWLESMLSVLDTPPVHNHHNSSNHNPVVIEGSSRVERDSVSHGNSQVFDDLSAIPGGAIYSQSDTERYSKRLKVEDAVISPVPGLNRPVVVVDSQETGVRLVHTLMACAEAVQHSNLKLADSLVKHIGLLAVSQVGSMRKVATYFAEALARRIYRIFPQGALESSSYSNVLEMHFYETCPYLKFAHFTANQALLEAFATANRVHVIDFGLKEGMQWPALMQALALRPGGPPAFRLTGIGPPQPDNTDALQQVGWKFARMAETIGIEFEFRGFFVNCLADLEPSILDIRPPEVEVVAVNSVFELHPLLAHPGAIEKVLNSIKAMKPLIVTVVEQEANHNGPVFMDRFNEALHYYSSLFDSLEGCPPSRDLVMSEIYLGQQICNVVACEGAARVERHETLAQWQSRMDSGGFSPVPLGSNAFNQASMLLSLFAGGNGYNVEETNGCLLLDWHTRPLIATSAWKLTSIDSN